MIIFLPTLFLMDLIILSFGLLGLVGGTVSIVCVLYLRHGERLRAEHAIARAERQADKFEKLADRWCGIAEREQSRVELSTFIFRCTCGFYVRDSDDRNVPSVCPDCNKTAAELKADTQFTLDDVTRITTPESRADPRNARVLREISRNQKRKPKPDPLDADHIG